MTAVLFATAMVIAQRLSIPDPVERILPLTGDDAFETTASERATEDVALATERGVSTPQTLDNGGVPKTTAEAPGGDDDAPAIDRPHDRDGADGAAIEKPDSTRRTTRTAPEETADAAPDEERPPQAPQPAQPPAPSEAASDTPIETSSLIVEPSSSRQRDAADRADRDRFGWNFFRQRDGRRSWWNFFSGRDDRRSGRRGH
jgi:hypothetical protein